MIALILSLFAAPSFAEDPEFVGTQDPADAVEEPQTNLSAELGGAYADGNVWYYTLNSAVTFSHKWARNQISAAGSASLGRAASDANENGRIDDDERPDTIGELSENARRIEGMGRYDRFVSDRGSVYVLTGALSDIYSGYDLRSHEQVGYSYRLLDSDTTTLRTELGADYAQEFYVEGTDPDYNSIIAARVLVGLTHQLNESVSFSDEVEIYENVLDLSDVRVLNSAVLSTALSDVFSVKLSHKLNFDNQPVDGFKPLDHTTLVTLVATLL